MDIGVDRTRDEVDRSFERLYRLHRGEVFGASLRELGNVHDAEDVTQAAFADAYRALLRGSWPHSPRAWLLAIAENVRRARFRAAGRRPQEEQADPDGMAATEPPHEQAETLVAALHSLPATQREVFVLRELAGLSYAEIGSRLGASVASVQMLLFRARRALRAELEPPAVSSRRPLALWPAWLLQLVSRGDRLFLTPRGAVPSARLRSCSAARRPAWSNCAVRRRARRRRPCGCRRLPTSRMRPPPRLRHWRRCVAGPLLRALAYR